MCNSEAINTTGMTEIDLNQEDTHKSGDHDTASVTTDDELEDYYTYREIRSLLSVPYADPQEQSSNIKRRPPEPFGQRAICALFLAVLAKVFGILAGILTEVSNHQQYWNEKENAIFYAQMLMGASMVLTLIAIRLLARVTRENQLIRLSRGKPMYQKAAWISYAIGILYSTCILMATFLGERPLSSSWVMVAVPLNFLPFVLMMIHAEAARKV